MKKSDDPLRFVANFICTVASLALLAGISGCGKGGDAKGGGPSGRTVLVRAEKVDERKLAPRVIVVGTVTAKRTSIVASGANGVVDRYFVEEGQWVNNDDDLSILRMKSTNEELDQAKALLKVRVQEEKEAKKYRDEEIKEAEFRMQAALSEKQNAEDRWKRAENAFKRGAINEEERDESLKKRDSADNLYKAARETHERMKAGPRVEKRLQAEFNREAQEKYVAYLEAEKEKRTTKAPFPGYVVKEHSYNGQWLSKGDPVATIAQLDEVDVVVNVDQADIRHVHLGKKAEIRIQGLDLIRLKDQAGKEYHGVLKSESTSEIEIVEPSGNTRTIARSDIAERRILPWTGRVVHIVPKSEWQTGSRGFPVKVRVKNWTQNVMLPPEKEGGQPVKRIVPILKEGMMATVEFQGDPVMAFLVPKDALVRSTDGIKINLFEPSKDDPTLGRTLQMTVTTGMGEGLWIQVIPSPSNAGEPVEIKRNMLVVTEGGERLLPVQGGVKLAPPQKKASDSPGKP